MRFILKARKEGPEKDLIGKRTVIHREQYGGTVVAQQRKERYSDDYYFFYFIIFLFTCLFFSSSSGGPLVQLVFAFCECLPFVWAYTKITASKMEPKQTKRKERKTQVSGTGYIQSIQNEEKRWRTVKIIKQIIRREKNDEERKTKKTVKVVKVAGRFPWKHQGPAQQHATQLLSARIFPEMHPGLTPVEGALLTVWHDDHTHSLLSQCTGSAFQPFALLCYFLYHRLSFFLLPLPSLTYHAFSSSMRMECSVLSTYSNLLFVLPHFANQPLSLPCCFDCCKFSKTSHPSLLPFLFLSVCIDLSGQGSILSKSLSPSSLLIPLPLSSAIFSIHVSHHILMLQCVVHVLGSPHPVSPEMLLWDASMKSPKKLRRILSWTLSSFLKVCLLGQVYTTWWWWLNYWLIDWFSLGTGKTGWKSPQC